MIPNKSNEGLEEEKLENEYEAIMKDRLNSDTPLTNNIKKYLKELLMRIGPEQQKKFVFAFEKGLDDLDEANEYTAHRYKLKPKKENNVYFSIEVMVDVMNYEKDDPELAFRCRDKQTNEVLFLWSHEKFLDRLELMRDWYSDIMDDGVSNRERFIDPWIDVSTQEEVDNQLNNEEVIKDQIQKLKKLIKECEEQEKVLSKKKDKIKKEINAILEKKPTVPDQQEMTMIERVKNRQPDKVEYVTKSLHDVAPLLDVRGNRKKYEKDLKKLEKELEVIKENLKKEDKHPEKDAKKDAKKDKKAEKESLKEAKKEAK